MEFTKKLLICDDSMLVRKQLKDFIDGFKFEFDVIEAKDGEEAFELYKQQKPDLVIMDVVMPRSNGIETLKKIIEYNANARVIMLTSVGSRETIKEALAEGALDFMQKPWNKELLIQIIEKYMPKEVNYDA